MKRNARDWLSHGAAAVLLMGAVGLIFWQGMQYVSEEKATQTVQRVQQITANFTAEMTTTALSDNEMKIAATSYSKSASGTSGKTSSTRSVRTQPSMVPDVADESEAELVSFPLELNQTTAEELEQLPGIGTVLAARIVEYRTKIGGFLYREQLLEVEGIGDATLEQIYDLIYLADEQIPSPTEQIVSKMPEQSEVNATDQTATVVETTLAVQEVVTETTLVSTEPLMVELNSADLDQLMKIPGITEELAKEILTFREDYGYYSSVYELLYLEHMTESDFTEMRQFICVEKPDHS